MSTEEEKLRKHMRSKIAQLYGVEEENTVVDDSITLMIYQIIKEEERVTELYQKAHDMGMNLQEAIMWVCEQIDLLRKS